MNMGGGESDNDEKDVVEGYIWESMQRNAQRMQQLRTEKGIEDPVELEREFLRNFKTNEILAGVVANRENSNNNNNVVSNGNVMMVQDDENG